MPSPRSPVSAFEALARQAFALALLFRDRGRLGPSAWRKAHDALRFSATTRARSLAVPSKLTGVRPSQASLAALSALRPPFGLRLDIVREDGGATSSLPGATRLAVRVSAAAVAGPLAGATLGYVQAKHVPWLLDLLPLGVEVRLTRVTGGGARGLFGCNVHFTGVGAALARLVRYGTTAHGAPPPPTDDTPPVTAPSPSGTRPPLSGRAA